ncbi:hypothetical protein MPSEU_000680300 [Mayamaea pseudoterrestris]|nr:hypothetical protein MPSEU_000680300 [Mayamaea pseudoterrestris]
MPIYEETIQISPLASRHGASSSSSDRAQQIPSKSSSLTRSSSLGGSPRLSRKDKDKIGRWSDEEHALFLDGLERHGKQWKMIADMIGTRTVVQVRTHAQKYFQKLERKTKSSSASVTSEDSFTTTSTSTSKRKTQPSAMPADDYDDARISKMLKIEPVHLDQTQATIEKEKLRITISLANIMNCNNNRDLPTPTADIIAHTSAVSCSSSSENLSIISPAGVNELDLGLWTGADTSLYVESNYDDPVADDPLDWFMLDSPDIPIFPDFQETLDLTSLHPKADLSAAVEILPCMDPKVTVQSLFLDEHPLSM